MVIIFIIGVFTGYYIRKCWPPIQIKKPKPHLLKDIEYERDWI